MSERRYFEHYTTDEPPRLDRWYCCECCGYPTLCGPKEYEVCQLCDWFDDDDYSGEGGASAVLLEAGENFRAYLTKYPPASNRI